MFVVYCKVLYHASYKPVYVKWILVGFLRNTEYIIVSVPVERFHQHKRFSCRNETGTSEETNTVAVATTRS